MRSASGTKGMGSGWLSLSSRYFRLWVLRAHTVMSIQQPARARAATDTPAPSTTSEVAKTATGAAARVSEFCVPRVLPRFSAGMRSKMKKPSRAEMGPAERPSMSALAMSSGSDGRRPSPKIPKAMPVSDRMYQVRRRSLWASAA